MANSSLCENEETASSAATSGSIGRHGNTYTLHTLGAPVVKISLLPKAPPPRRRLTLREVWWNIWETDPPVFPIRLASRTPWPKNRRFLPAFLTSSLLHSSLVFFAYSVPFALILALFMAPPPPGRVNHTRTIVFKIPPKDLANYLPFIKPPGRGRAPGRGSLAGTRPRLGSVHFDPRVTIISNPPHPDNFRVTLRNNNAPPALKLPQDLRLPDFISGGPALIPEPPKPAPPAPEKPAAPAPPKPPPPNPLESKPLVPQLKPPVLAAAPPPPPALALKVPQLAAPHLEIPVPPPPVTPAPPPVAEASAATRPPSPAPKAVQRAADAPPAPPANRKSASEAAGDSQKAGGGPKILSLSVDPVPLTDAAAIPGGQHEGAFTISPSATAQGSPGGTPDGKTNVGVVGPGGGGDQSVAVGTAKPTPGGGGAGGSVSTPPGNPTVSVSGPGAGGKEVAAGTLAPLKFDELVYEVKPETPKAHAPALVVSTGSAGGGGLRLFGVLHGDRIYTVYFSMPGKSWILQYCVHETAPPVNPATRVVQIHMAPPLTPPAAIALFDFHRPPAPPGANNPLIVLHGFIQADGSVSDLTVLHGLDPTSDAAACAAFSRWKFKPALRAGTPVPLEILVGVP